MYYAVDDNLFTRLKSIAASDPNNADLDEALTAAEANPLITSLIWTKVDVLAACRKLINGDKSKNADGSWFKRDLPFLDTVREQLALEIVGNPDEFCIVIRDEVDNGIELTLIDRIRDEVEAELGEIGADHQGYDGVPGDYAILEQISHLPEEILAVGLNACAREIAERALRGLMG